MTTNTKYVQAQDFFLSGSGSITGATSIILKSFKAIDGITLLTMTDFGAVGFATIEPGNGTQEEQISFTGVTQNSNGTATLTGVKSVLFLNPYTATAGTNKTHAGSTTLIITNTSGFYDQFPAKANDETIEGSWTFNGQQTFTNFPITPATQLATEVVAGFTILSVAAADVNNPIVVGTNDNRVPVGYAADSVGSDSYAITPTPAETAYVTGKEYTFKAGTANTGACSLNVSGLGAKTIKKAVSVDLETGDILANQIVVCKYDGTNMQMVSKSSLIKFGGTGADGALSSNAGATNIDLGGAAVVVKNYTSISLTGTASLTVSNPHAKGTILIIKSQGDVTITSSTVPAITVVGMGGLGTSGGNGQSNVFVETKGGTQRLATAGTSDPGIAIGGFVLNAAMKTIPLACGGGGAPVNNNGGENKMFAGAGGGSASNSGAACDTATQTTEASRPAGGRGGGALYIECGGAYNVSSTISAAGAAGASSGGAYTGSGGGGGGTIIVLYKILTADTGTYTVAGGAAGAGTTAAGGAGGAGQSLVTYNTEFY